MTTLHERALVMARCETCRFRKPDVRYDYRRYGNCVRYPPQMLAWSTIDGQSVIETHWPWMEPTDWCGEYSPHESPRP